MQQEKWTKPDQVTCLREVSEEVFGLLKKSFDIGDTYTLPLTDVDSAEPVLQNTEDIAAMAMRKVQALRFISRPGVPTTNDVIVGLCAELTRMLRQLSRHMGADGDTLAGPLRQIMEAGRTVAAIDGNEIVDFE